MKTPDELYLAGRELLHSNPSEAARLFEQAGNHDSAMFTLAQMHHKMMYPEATFEKAFELYTVLAKRLPQCALILGMMYCRGGEPYGNPWPWDQEKAHYWLVEMFEPFAIKNLDEVDGFEWGELGDAYCTGRLRKLPRSSDDPIFNVTREDLEKATLYLEKALNKGDMDSEHSNVTQIQLETQRRRLRDMENYRKNIKKGNALLMQLGESTYYEPDDGCTMSTLMSVFEKIRMKLEPLLSTD
jgi:TPR repeat protein